MKQSLVLFFMCFFLNASSQPTDSYLGANLAYQYSAGNYFKLGVSQTKTCGFQSEKYSLRYLRGEGINGVDLDYMFGMLYEFGANINTSFSKDKTNLGVAPKLGFGFPMFFSVSYGYNFLIIKEHNLGINGSFFEVEVNIPIYKYKSFPSGNGRMFFGLLKF